MMFETGQTSEPTSANISIVSPSSKRGPTMLHSFPQHFQQYCARARHQRVVISLWRVHFAQLNISHYCLALFLVQMIAYFHEQQKV